MAVPNEKIANEIYDVLVMCGGAIPDTREHFIYAHLDEEYPCNEYRFQGHFGFGGKFYSDGFETNPWHIGYHPDDTKGKNEELYHSLMVAMNSILISIWEKWKNNTDRCRDGHGNNLPAATLVLPDAGEDTVEVRLILPSREEVHIGYKCHYGTMDVCVYEPQDGSDKKAPGAPALRSKPVVTTCWTDKLDENGHYVSSMHPAPRVSNALHHERLATQIVLSVGPNHEEIFTESDVGEPT